LDVDNIGKPVNLTLEVSFHLVVLDPIQRLDIPKHVFVADGYN